MERLSVFVDESGDEHLNIASGASKSYVLAAVIIKDEMLQSVTAAADLVRRRYFQAGEMKSSGIGNNAQRRKVVLQALSELDFHVVAFCVPKQQLGAESPFRFRSVFLKYTAGRLCMHLPRKQQVQVIFDGKGRAKFKDEFKAYLENRFPRDDLFQSISFSSIDSKECLPVQVADIFAGSIAKKYERHGSASDLEISAILNGKTTAWEWPTSRNWGSSVVHEDGEELDVVVYREALRRATNFLDIVHDESDDIRLRCVFLKWLIDHSARDDQEFMLSDEIRRRFRHELGVELDGQALRNRIVGPLRDSDLLIASSSKGYRLPGSVKDIRGYVDLCSTQIPPALARVRRARDIIRSSTIGELDILAGDHLTELRKAVEATAPMG
jgi:hypothetical protein